MEKPEHKLSLPFWKWNSPHHTPPTAVPIHLQDIWSGLSAYFHLKSAEKAFRKEVANFLDTKNCFLVSSGRAALTLILSAAKQSSSRSEVIIPAYGCPTVTQSILAAELKPVYCDVSPQTLDLDREDLIHRITENTLAIIPTHLYGLAQDISDLIEIGHNQGIIIIEDAAQSFGATVNNIYVGTRGDAGLFSLGRGKCLPTGNGGIIVAQEYLEIRIKNILQEILQPVSNYDLKSILSYSAYGAAILPIIWWFIVRSELNPANEGMESEDLPQIEIKDYSKTQAAIGSSILKRYQDIILISRQNATRMMSQILEFSNLRLPDIPLDSKPVFLRLPMMCDNQNQAEDIFTKLNRCGIGISKSYTRTVPEIFSKNSKMSQIDFPGASHLAECLLTLPTHQFVREADFHCINKTLLSTT